MDGSGNLNPHIIDLSNMKCWDPLTMVKVVYLNCQIIGMLLSNYVVNQMQSFKVEYDYRRIIEKN